jgi:hypothetical protein
MAVKKDSKAMSKKTRFVFGREMSEDAIIKALKKMSREAGMKFGPAKKFRKKK